MDCGGYKTIGVDLGDKDTVSYALTVVVVEFATSLRMTCFCLALHQGCRFRDLTDGIEC
jgi:hypothetical protein